MRFKKSTIKEINPVRFNRDDDGFKKYPEGIEREDVKNTPGVHWTQEELREFVKGIKPITFD